MIFDWLAREGWIVFNWWLLVSLMGLATLPLLLRLMGGLPDRGYALAKPAGLLLTAFTFWLLASLGFLNNSTGSIVLSVLVVLAVSLFVFFRASDSDYTSRFDLRTWWRENRAVVIAVEVLFILLLVGWATVRAHNNSFAGTEKPMDLAFMSAIQRSETFPPNDPWLSDYSISYYYFGYVMAAMLSEASGIWTTSGYNMHIALLFALTGVGAFGVTVNLVRSRLRKHSESLFVPFGVGVLSLVFMTLLGTFHTPLVKLPHTDAAFSEGYYNFWDTKYENTLEGETAVDFMTLNNFNWWFDGTRAVRDLTLDGQHIEVIVEFPQFSFLLADSHPHVMALPFTLLAMGLALNVLLARRGPTLWQIALYGVVAGGLIFLNTWDAPIYIAVIVGAEALRRLRPDGRLDAGDWVAMFGFGAALLVIAVAAYLPFLVGFRSQLGGLLPNIIWPTRTQQLFLVMSPFFFLLPPFLWVEAWRARKAGTLNWRLGWQVAGGILLALVAGLALFMIFGALNPAIRQTVYGAIDAAGGLGEILPTVISRRIEAILTPIVLVLVVVTVVAVLFPRRRHEVEADKSSKAEVPYPPANGFALMMIAAGALLILIPEFVYLRDNFGQRMNTIFKFYYAAWTLFSIASAYGIYALVADPAANRPPLPVRAGALVVLALVLVLGLIYPVLGINYRMYVETRLGEQPDASQVTLDGGPSLAFADDYESIMCLHDMIDGDDAVVAELVTGSYREGGRLAALTGIPTVVGWPGHQGQWRGTAYNETVGSRPDDMARLYTDMRLENVAPLLQQYDIDYVMFGVAERNRYGTAGEEKFAQNFEAVCRSSSGQSVVYRVDEARVADFVASQ